MVDVLIALITRVSMIADPIKVAVFFLCELFVLFIVVSPLVPNKTHGGSPEIKRHQLRHRFNEPGPHAKNEASLQAKRAGGAVLGHPVPRIRDTGA